MKSLTLATAASLLIPLALAFGEMEGMQGYHSYDPLCAMACLRSIYSMMLDCSDGGQRLGMMGMMTSTTCWAQNTPYLTTLAYCMSVKCDKDIPRSKLETFWENEATGQKSAGVATVPAKWSYGDALAHVDGTPSVQLVATDTMLNTTSLVDESTYKAQYNVLYVTMNSGSTLAHYGTAMLVTGFVLPIIMTVLGYTPCLASTMRRLKPYLSWPSSLGTYHVRPLPYLLGNAPTVGQSLYIALFLFLNIILTSVGYVSRQPNAWNPTVWKETMAAVLGRTGVYPYQMAPLLFLFAGRNNVLLWLTNWSHSTFMVLHRWIGRIFCLQVLIHSIVSVVLYKAKGTYDEEVKQPYWVWGIVATLCTVFLTFGSGLYIRSFQYEAFLISHIVLSIILVVGCWYHAYDLYAFLGGYCDWLIAVFAVWGFDRIARVVRIAMVGPRRAIVTEIGQGYVRIDIPGVRWGSDPGKHCYVYFPTLHKLQPWVNHPFSVLSTALLHPPHFVDGPTYSGNESQSQNSGDIEKTDGLKPAVTTTRVQQSRLPGSACGLTMYVRKSGGTTRALAEHASLFTLIEGPYPNNSTAEILRSDRLLLICGGIGITALLPFANNHWNVKLAWSVKDSAQCLVNDLEGALGTIVEKDIQIGRRLDIRQLLAEEVEAGWDRVGVVVAGPGAMCDDVRAAVVQAAKASAGRTEFELEVEAYSW